MRVYVIHCEARTLLDEFRTRLLQAFEGTYEGAAHHYLGCHIECDIQAGTTILSQKYYAEEVLCTFNHWDVTVPCLTPMPPNTRLSVADCDKTPDPAFHRRYRGILGSLGF